MPKILDSLTQIGKSLGTFHSYHALKNPKLRRDCIRYILKIGNLNTFSTITHHDFHLGNIFVSSNSNISSRVTFIDLESMFLSTITPSCQSVDVLYFIEKMTKVLKSEVPAIFIEQFKKSYKEGLRHTLQYFVGSNLLKKDLIITLRSQSLPKAKTDLFPQDSSEMSSDQPFDW